MEQQCVLLSGSWARGKQNQYSDIDIIVITASINHFHTETIWNNGEELQIILLPKSYLHKMILEKSNTSNSILVSMLKSVIVLSDDEHQYASRITHYVDNNDFQANEHVVSAQMCMLKNRCEDLKHCEDELTKNLLVSTIIILLSHILSKVYDTGVKHCVRALKDTPEREQLMEAISEYQNNGDFSPLISLSENTTSCYIQEIQSTGRTLNNLKENDVIVAFLPSSNIEDKGVFELLLMLTRAFEKYNIYSFHCNRLQFLNEGQYIIINSENESAISILSKLRVIQEKIEDKLILNRISMLLPYYTNYASGVFFGGKRNMAILSPIFSAIWKEWISLRDNSFSIACAILLLAKMNETYQLNDKDSTGLFDGLLENILPNVIDKYGVLNVEQTNITRKKYIELLAEKYDEIKEDFCDDMADILNNQVSELINMNLIASELTNTMKLIPESDLHYPNIFPFTKNRDIFYIEVCNQILSILQLEEENKCSVVFNLLASSQKDLDSIFVSY